MRDFFPIVELATLAVGAAIGAAVLLILGTGVGPVVLAGVLAFAGMVAVEYRLRPPHTARSVRIDRDRGLKMTVPEKDLLGPITGIVPPFVGAALLSQILPWAFDQLPRPPIAPAANLLRPAGVVLGFVLVLFLTVWFSERERVLHLDPVARRLTVRGGLQRPVSLLLGEVVAIEAGSSELLVRHTEGLVVVGTADLPRARLKALAKELDALARSLGADRNAVALRQKAGEALAAVREPREPVGE